MKKKGKQAKRGNPNNNNGAKLAIQLTNVNAEIDELEHYLKGEKAKRLVSVVRKSGWYKGEIVDLTPKQFRDLLGYTPKQASIRKGKVPWEYCFDQLATELKYPSDEALKKAVESVIKTTRQIDRLKAEKNILESEIKAMPKAKEPRAAGVKFEKKRIAVDGKVTAYEITSGKQRLGYIVAFPPTYGIYPSTNGLDIRKAAIGGARSIKKAKEVAKKELRR